MSWWSWERWAPPALLDTMGSNRGRGPEATGVTWVQDIVLLRRADLAVLEVFFFQMISACVHLIIRTSQ